MCMHQHLNLTVQELFINVNKYISVSVQALLTVMKITVSLCSRYLNVLLYAIWLFGYFTILHTEEDPLGLDDQEDS